MTGVESFTTQVKRTHVHAPRENALRRSGGLGDRLARGLDASISRGDAPSANAILDCLLEPDMTTLAVFRRTVEAMGGREAFIQRIHAFLQEQEAIDRAATPQRRADVAARIAARFNNDRPPDAGFTAEDALELLGEMPPAALAVGPLVLVNPIAAGVVAYHVISPYIDEVLRTAKDFWNKAAERLADGNHPWAAGALQTVNDILVPGSTLEAILGLLPIGKLGVLIKAVLQKAVGAVAARLAATGLPKIARALQTHLDGLIAKHVAPLLSRYENALANRIVAAATTEGRENAVREAWVFLEKLNRTFSVADDLGGAVRKSRKTPSGRRMSRRAAARAEADLRAHFPVPEGSLARNLSFEVLPDGKVLQSFRAKLAPHPDPADRASAAAVADQLGLAGREGEHWGHLVASRLSGDDQVYNLIRVEARVNTSFMTVFDKLPPGAEIEIKVLFDSFEDAMGRFASGLQYRKVATNEIIGDMADLLGRPEMTLRAAKREAQRLAQQVAATELDDETAQLIQHLAEIFDLGSLRQ
jgi:hypothetical protein